jgi:hypothetical protein
VGQPTMTANASGKPIAIVTGQPVKVGTGQPA